MNLLPCPFCGARAALCHDDGHSQAGCSRCGAEQSWEQSDAAAIAAWNQRALSDSAVSRALDVWYEGRHDGRFAMIPADQLPDHMRRMRAAIEAARGEEG